MIQIDLKVLLFLISFGIFSWGTTLTIRRVLVEWRIKRKRAQFRAEEKRREDACYAKVVQEAIAEAERILAERKP